MEIKNAYDNCHKIDIKFAIFILNIGIFLIKILNYWN